MTNSISGITFDPVAPLGASNLLTILSAYTGKVPAVLDERYAESNHGALKKDAVEAMEEAMGKPRAEFARLREDRTFPAQIARDGAEKTLRTARWEDEGSSAARRTKVGVVTLTA